MDQLSYEEWDLVYAGDPSGYSSLQQVVLNQINDIRRALAIGEGKLPGLPPAKKGDPHQCVLARALSNGWEPNIEEYIELHHDYNGKIDVDKIANTLEDLGYTVEVDYEKEVATWNESTRYWDYSYVPHYLVRIYHTPETNAFIELFDEGVFPKLVVTD